MLNQSQKPLKSTPHSTKGFTLLEMLAVLLILSIGFATGLSVYNQYNRTEVEKLNIQKQSELLQGIAKFLNLHGRYPCPASLTAGPSNPKFGVEDCSVIVTGPGTGIPTGECRHGICVKESPRALGNGTVPRVLIGAIPFKTLGIAHSRSLDQYGSRLVYAVTELLTTEKFFASGLGGIEVVTRDPASTSDPADDASNTAEIGSIPFAIISMGADRAGAFNSEGYRTSPCPAAGEGQLPTLDSINCQLLDGDGILPTSQRIARFRHMGKTLGPETIGEKDKNQIRNYYDDDILLRLPGGIQEWRSTNGRDIFLRDSNAPIIIGNNDFTVGAKMYVMGDVRSDAMIGKSHVCSDANLLSTDLCFRINSLGGSQSDTTGCPEGQKCNGMLCKSGYMVGFNKGAPVCSDVIEILCPDPKTERVVGINKDGPVCAPYKPPAMCEAQNVTLCSGSAIYKGNSQDYNNPAVFNSESASTSLPKAKPEKETKLRYLIVAPGKYETYAEWWKCSDQGQWTRATNNGAEGGVCPCDPGKGTATTYGNCVDPLPANRSMTKPDWWSGKIATSITFSCDKSPLDRGEWRGFKTTVVDNSKCVCECDDSFDTTDTGKTNGCRYVKNQNCPALRPGAGLQLTRAYSCTKKTPSAPTDYAYGSAFSTGTFGEYKNMSLPATDANGNYVSFDNATKAISIDSCKCQDNQENTIEVDCPKGFTDGAGKRKYVLQCNPNNRTADGKWVQSGPDDFSECQCLTGTVEISKAANCPTLEGGEPQHGYVSTVRVSSCSAIDKPGTVTYETDYSNCEKYAYAWKITGVQLNGPYQNINGAKEGATCTYQDQKTSSNVCYKKELAGYYRYECGCIRQN